MAKPFQVTKITGMASLSTKLSKRLPQSVRSRLKQAIAEGADDIVALQKKLAPVKSGKLRDSIVATMGGGEVPKYAAFRNRKQGKSRNSRVIEVADPDLSAVITAGNNAVRYAHLVEFDTAPHINGGKFAGTEHPGAKAKPFFYPGYRANKRPIKNKFRAAIRKGIREALGK